MTLRLDHEERSLLRDVLVTVIVDEANRGGVKATTDRYSRATFKLSAKTQQIETLHANPLHEAWLVALPAVAVGEAGALFKVLPIDPVVADASGLIYRKPPAGAGKEVEVAVVETGVGMHSAWPRAGRFAGARGLHVKAAESTRRACAVGWL